MKTVIGVVFCVIAIATALFGIRLAWLGGQLVSLAGGQGTIRVVAEGVGEVTGINGAAAVLVAGLAILLCALALTLKAVAEVKYEVADARKAGKKPPNPVWTAVKHFNPGL